MNVDRAIEDYIVIRTARDKLKKEWEAKDEALKSKLGKIEIYLLQKSSEEGTDTFRTQSGTAYKVVNLKANCVDYPVLFNWIVQNNLPDLLTKRISTAALKEFMDQFEEGQKVIPPGINVVYEVGMNVQRPRAK